MKRSEINALVREATATFEAGGWALPPQPQWDVTDFGLGKHEQFGLVLVNLCEETEYCEKLMYARKGMATPGHAHAKKKEDIIVRRGEMRIRLTLGPGPGPVALVGPRIPYKLNGVARDARSGTELLLRAGERITLYPGVYHEFAPTVDGTIIGEVSTANDDLNDNFFLDPEIGRYASIEEDEAPVVRLVSDR
ncbi:D-lyxose/D-mannose family sugar isomerase [bacterium]|nr:MAG: D-lyxose/D-mannose family sugar isomerase [bacterium]